jgi:hypothetical protein
MSRPRWFLVLLGISFLVAGLVVASAVERTIGLGFFIVGAFLLVTPFLGVHEQE